MIYRILFMLTAVTYACYGMEPKIKIKNPHCVFKVKTNDNQLVDIPLGFIAYSQTLRDMWQDFTQQQDIEIPLAVNGAVLRNSIKLVFLHGQNKDNDPESAIKVFLKDVRAIEVAAMLVCVNYLDIRALISPLLMILSEKIYDVLMQPGDQSKISENKPNLFNDLEILLPEELQLLVKKCLLLNYGLITYFMGKRMLPHQMPTDHSGITGFEKNEHIFTLYHSDNRFDMFDLSVAQARKIGSFNSNARFSPDKRYISNPDSRHFKADFITLVELQTGRTMEITGNNGEFIPDSTLFVSDTGNAFDLEQWQMVKKNTRLYKTLAKVPFVPRETRRGLQRRAGNTVTGFTHPEFSKLENQSDIDAVCLQLPVELHTFPFNRLNLANEIYKVCISNNRKWAAFGYMKDREKVLDVYNISDVNHIELQLTIKGIRGFALHEDLLCVATDSRVEQFNLQKKVTLYSMNLKVSSISFDADCSSFIVMEIEKDLLKKMTAYFFERSLNVFFELNFPLDSPNEPDVYYSLQEGFIVKERAQELMLINMPLRDLLQNVSLKTLIEISRKKILERRFSNAKPNTSKTTEPKETNKRERDEDNDGNDRPHQKQKKE